MAINTETLGKSKLVNLFFKPAGLLMGSRLRKRLMPPEMTLQIADVQQGQTVLDVGCGTGFFTVAAAEMVGSEGRIIALDASSGFLEEVSKKVKAAGINNVLIVQRDALRSGLETASIDKALLFGVIPFPLLPLDKLLPEMHRVLKPGATMSVWLFPPLVHNWVAKVIVNSGLFKQIEEKRNVYNFLRI